MDISLRFVNITVNDIDESLSFYRDALGLERAQRRGIRRIPLADPREPGTAGLESFSPSRTPAAPRPTATRCRSSLTKGVLPDHRLPHRTTSTAIFEKVRASGAEVLQEPIEQPWGPRDCAFRDPSGNIVRISQAG